MHSKANTPQGVKQYRGDKLKYTSTIKPRKCPVCGSTKIAKILYGLPVFSKELENALNSGDLILGGCCFSIDDPRWQCANCKTYIFQKHRLHR
jgi:hypothetical protein